VKRIRVLAGIILTILFLFLVLWRIDFDEMGKALGTANYWYVIPAVACTFLGYVIRTIRWSVLLSPTKRISIPNLFPLLMIGFMANNVLPARIGEFVRAYNLGAKEGISKSAGLATVVLERLFDGITLILFIAILSLLCPLPGWGSELAVISALVFAAAFVVLVLLLIRKDFALSILNLILRPLPKRIASRAEGMASLFVVGLDVLKGAPEVVATLALSVVVWVLEASSYYLIISGFNTGLEGPERIFASLFLLVVVNLGIMIPSAPGYVGTFQFFGVLALGAFGEGRELALSVAVVSHAMQWIMVTGIGFICFSVQNLSFGRITGEERT
jgi:uncharacterized protein (TIRG00374 family)